MTSNFLPAAVAVILFVTGSTALVQAQGYSGLIADDSLSAPEEKPASKGQGGYGGLIAPASPAENGESAATGGQQFMIAPAPSKTKEVIKAERKKQKAEQAKNPMMDPDRDPNSPLNRLRKAGRDENFRQLKEAGKKRMDGIFPMSDGRIAMLKEKYEEPPLANGMTRNEALIAKNVNTFMEQINQPDISQERRLAIAKDAYEQLKVLETGTALRANAPEKSYQKLIDRGISKAGIQTYIQGEKNAHANLTAALKMLEPLQAAQ